MRLVSSTWWIGITFAVFACDGATGTVPNTVGSGSGQSKTTQSDGSGGQTQTGKSDASGGTAESSSGESDASGGTEQTSQATGSGGQTSTGSGGQPQTSASGGKSQSSGSGGSSPSTAKGGTSASGGSSSTAKGGSASGGSSTSSSATNNPSVCDDVASKSATVNKDFAAITVATSNNANKTYIVHTNWWGKFKDQTVSVKNLGFSVGNPSNVSTDTSSLPIGYPSIFIGKYQTYKSDGSNLPKLVSSIQSVPTVFDTNATSMENSQFNAAYDVWLTASGNVLSDTASDPGSGGAFLMVWMYKPSGKQPRGSTIGTATIAGQNWDIWADSTNPPCISYVAKTPLPKLSFDLNDFIKDGITRGKVKSTMYLSVVFAGFEIWSGGDKATVNNFCAKVN